MSKSTESTGSRKQYARFPAYVRELLDGFARTNWPKQGLIEWARRVTGIITSARDDTRLNVGHGDIELAAMVLSLDEQRGLENFLWRLLEGNGEARGLMAAMVKMNGHNGTAGRRSVARRQAHEFIDALRDSEAADLWRVVLRPHAQKLREREDQQRKERNRPVGVTEDDLREARRIQRELRGEADDSAGADWWRE